jgi:Ran GTPase-activating protein (RanGAP) involved in mRNA processing and transport
MKRAISFQNQEGNKDVDGDERYDSNGRRNNDEWLEFEGQPAQHVMPQIARALWNSAHIKGLKMRNGGLGAIASCVSDLSRPLAVNHILVHLDVSHNEMDCLATALLATALCSNSSLQQLFLSHNRIGPNGGRHIAQALKRNKTLVLLDLSYNPLGPSGTSCVGMSLNFNTSLTTLLLRGNRGGNVAASFVAEAIKRQGTVGAHGVHGATVVPQLVQHGPLLSRSSLTHVDLSENEITDVGAQALVRALQRNPSIKSLDLDKNDIEIALVDSIRVLTRRAADTARQEGAHALASDERTLSSDTVRIL